MAIRNLLRKRKYSVHEKNARNRIYAHRINNGGGVNPITQHHTIV